MIDRIGMLGRNVVDLRSYQAARREKAKAISARLCRHCGAAMLDGESDDDCSSAGISATGISATGIGVPAPMLRKFYAD